MAEGGGFVSFDEKVAEPSERVGGNRRAKQPPCVSRYSRDDDEQKDKARSDKMPAPRRSFAMLGQIERPKFFIVSELYVPLPLAVISCTIIVFHPSRKMSASCAFVSAQ